MVELITIVKVSLNDVVSIFKADRRPLSARSTGFANFLTISVDRQFSLVNFDWVGLVVNRGFHVVMAVGNILNGLNVVTIRQVTRRGLGSINRVPINRW